MSKSFVLGSGLHLFGGFVFCLGKVKGFDLEAFFVSSSILSFLLGESGFELVNSSINLSKEPFKL